MKKTILALVLAAGLTSFAGSAKAGLTYNFSFNGNANFPGSVAGVLTLNDAGTQANSVYLTDSTITYNSFDWSSGYNLFNSFTVDNGIIVSANFGAFSSDYTGNLFLDAKGFINRYSPDGGYKIMNLDGLNGITFTPVTGGADTAAVPEPSQVAASILLIGGIAGFVIVRRRKESALALAA